MAAPNDQLVGREIKMYGGTSAPSAITSAGLTSFAVNGNLIDDVGEVGDISQESNIITYLAIGQLASKSKAGVPPLPEFSFTLNLNPTTHASLITADVGTRYHLVWQGTVGDGVTWIYMDTEVSGISISTPTDGAVVTAVISFALKRKWQVVDKA